MNDIGSTLVAHCGARKVTRDELKEIPVPEGTKTHQPLSHHEIVEVLDEALSFRNLSVVNDEYAVSHDGMKMFGVMDLNYRFTDCRFSMRVSGILCNSKKEGELHNGKKRGDTERDIG